MPEEFTFEEAVGESAPAESFSFEEAQPSGVLRRYLADPAISLAKGVIGLPEAAVGIADIPTFGAAGKLLEAGGYGFQPKFTKEWLSKGYSPEAKESQAAVQKVKGFFPTIGAMVEHPSTIADTVIESLPSMIGGAGVGRKVLTALPKLGAVVGAAVGEGAVTAGQTAEQFRQESPSGYITPKQAAVSVTSGVVTGLLGVVGGKIAKSLGIADPDVLFTTGMAQESKKNIFRRIAEGLITEGALEELPQSAQEQLQQNIANNKPMFEGVAEAAATGFMAGGVTGGAVNIPSGRGGKLRQSERQDEATTRPGTIQGENETASQILARQNIAIEPATTEKAAAGVTQPQGPGEIEPPPVPTEPVPPKTPPVPTAPVPPKPTPESIAAATGFKFAPAFGAVSTEGFTPEQAKQMTDAIAAQPWHFTDERPDSPTRSMSVSVPPGSTPADVQAAIDAKMKAGFSTPVIPPSVNEIQGAAPVLPLVPAPSPAVATAKPPTLQELDALIINHGIETGRLGDLELLTAPRETATSNIGSGIKTKVQYSAQLKAARERIASDLGIAKEKLKTPAGRAAFAAKLNERIASTAKLVEVPLTDMPEGAEFTIHGEKFTVKETNEAGIVTLKDGRTLKVNERSSVKVDPGSLNVKEAEGDQPFSAGGSEGQTATPEQVQAAIAGENNFGFRVNVVSFAEAQAMIDEQYGGSVVLPDNVGGFFHNGQIWLVTEGLPVNQEIIRQVFREEAAHGLLKTPLGQQLLQGLQMTGEERDAIRRSDPAYANFSDQKLLEEFVAKSARENTPWWRQAVDAVRAFLAKYGLTLSNDVAARVLLKNLQAQLPGSEVSAVVVGEGVPLSVANLDRQINALRNKQVGQKLTAQEEQRLRDLEAKRGQMDLPGVNTEAAFELEGEARREAAPKAKPAAQQDLLFSVGNDPRDKVHQVMGTASGATKTVQEMGRIQILVRKDYFDGTKPVSAEETERARNLVRQMTDPNERKLVAQELADFAESAGGGMDAIGQMIVNELADYATKLALTGDFSLGRDVVRNWHQFGILPAGAGLAAAGRALRSVQEAVSYRFYQTANEMLTAGSQLAREAAGVGTELWERLIATMQELKIDPAQFNTKLIDDKIPVTTPEQQADRTRVALETEGQEAESKTERYAQRRANRLELTEWPGKPEQTNDVKRVIAEFLKSNPPLSQTLSIEPLALALVGVGVTPETADLLAYNIFNQRERQWAGARTRAIKRAAARKGNLRALIEEIQSTPYLAQKDAAWRRQTAEEWFMAAGLSREQAQEAAKLFDEQFQAALTKAAEVEAGRVLDGGNLSPATKDTILRAIRSGLLDPANEWYGDLLKAKGITPLSDADFKLLAELDQKYSNPDLSLPEKSEIADQIFTIWRRLNAPPGILDRMASNLVVTNLTGLPTYGVNIFAPQALTFLEVGFTALSSPKDFQVTLKAILDAGKTWLSQMRYSLGRDAYSFLENDFAQSSNTLKGQWERGMRQMASKKASDRVRGATNIFFGWQQYAMRLLNALDNANGLVKQQVQMALYASQSMRHLGFTTKEIRETVDMLYLMKEQFYALAVDEMVDPNERFLKTRWTAKNNAAIVRADSLALQAFGDFLKDKVGDTVAREINRSSELDAYSMLGRLGPGIKEFDEGGLFSRFGLGWPMLQLSSWMRRQPGLVPALGVAMLGYVNVPYRAARAAAWNTPYGLLRLGINAWRKSKGKENWWKQSLATEAQERFRLKQAIAGSTVLALVTGLGLALTKTSADDGAGDDDDKDVYFTGTGPKNKNLRSAWMARGFKPNSMVFVYDKNRIAVPMSRSGEVLAHLAWILSARDQKAWRAKEAAATGRTIEPDITKEAAQAVGTYLGLMGQRGFLQTLFQAGQVGSGSEDPRRFAATKGAGFVAGLVTPGLGLQRSVVNLLQGSPDTSSISAAVAANFPVLGLLGDTFREPLVNRLGDPLYNPDDSWYHKMYYTGLPIAIGVSDSANNRATYGLMVNKGVAPPELRRAALEEKYGPLNNEQFREFAETSGRIIKRELIGNEPILRNQSPADVKKWMSKTATNADRITAIGMNLEPVKPSASSAGGSAPAAVSSLPASSQASSPTRTSRAPAGRIRSSIGRGRSRSGRLRLATMRVPRLRGGRVRASLRRTGRLRSSFRARRTRRILA